jgi:hypothetical protein
MGAGIRLAFLNWIGGLITTAGLMVAVASWLVLEGGTRGD